KGLKQGDRVVTSGSFLVDAETRLNPAAGSIYFGGSGGNKSAASAANVRPSTPEDKRGKIAAALAKLSPADRAAAEAEELCPVLDGSPLGGMGVPVKLTLEGQDVFLCCKNCLKRAQASPAETLARAKELIERKKQAQGP